MSAASVGVQLCIHPPHPVVRLGCLSVTTLSLLNNLDSDDDAFGRTTLARARTWKGEDVNTVLPSRKDLDNSSYSSA